jgi:hypothetical protein
MDQAVAAALTEREEQQDKQQSLQITSDNLLDTHRYYNGHLDLKISPALQQQLGYAPQIN